MSTPLDIAKLEAESSTMKQRHGACVVKNGKIISSGRNRTRTKWPSIHAEIDALRNLSFKDRYGSTVYVVRVGTDGTLRNSMPCKMCSRCMLKWGVEAVWSK